MSNTKDDAKKGGDLFDMAKDGTSIPNDAGVQRLIPSVPNPHQLAQTNEGLGAPDQASVADNATDMPRSTKDMGSSGGEIVSGTGDQMPSEITTKHAHYGGGNGLAKGSERYDKHTKSKESDLEYKAGAGAGVEPPPGEQGRSQDEIRDARGL